MSMKVIVLDGEAFQNQPARQSLLSLPMAETTVLGALVERLQSLGVADVLVLHGGRALADVVAQVATHTALRIEPVDQRALAREIADSEIGDHYLIIDPRYWPVDDPHFELLGDPTEYRGVTHVVAAGQDSTGAVRERVERDQDGMLERVQRWYDSVNWPEHAMQTILYTRVPARLLAGMRFESLAELRHAFSARGAFSRDVPLWGKVFDLMNERSYLQLNQQLIRRRSVRPRRKREDEGVVNVLGKGSRIDPSARLIAPVIVQAGARIEAGASVVGPAVIGAGACIEPDARVLQSVVDAGSVIAAGETIRHRVVLRGDSTGRSDGRASAQPEWLEDSSHDVYQASDGKVEIADEQTIASRRIQLLLKRLMDVVLSGTALVILFPFMAVVAALVKLSSPGPVLFGHCREGRFGKEFRCWKFRTMVADAHRMQRDLYKQNEVDGPQFKLAHDPRMTRIGRWLRSTNIDELPQLVNVLLGHMSLVGPRPSPFRENQVCVPWRRARLSVRPGISGLWQVCRNQDRSEGDFHEWIYYDIVYVRHYSLWLDVKILLATIASLGGKWSLPMHWLTSERGPHLRWGERAAHACQFYPLQPNF